MGCSSKSISRRAACAISSPAADTAANPGLAFLLEKVAAGGLIPNLRKRLHGNPEARNVTSPQARR